MPTTILDGETYEQARHRRFTEEAKVIEKMQQDRIIEMARELVTKHGTRLCDEDGETHGYELYCVGIDDIAEIIKQVAAHERDKLAEQEPVGIYYGEAEGVGHRVRLDVELPVGTDLYAALVRTKDLTDDEINEVLWRGGPFETVLDATRAVIAADRKLNGVEK